MYVDLLAVIGQLREADTNACLILVNHNEKNNVLKTCKTS